MTKEAQILPANTIIDNRELPTAPEVEVESQAPFVDDREITLRSIEALRVLMLADITVESKVPGIESHVRPAFSDKEVELLKSKIFKLIAKI